MLQWENKKKLKKDSKCEQESYWIKKKTLKENINPQIYQPNIKQNTYEHININTKYCYLRFKLIYWKYTVIYTSCSNHRQETAGRWERYFFVNRNEMKLRWNTWNIVKRGSNGLLHLSTFKQSSKKIHEFVIRHCNVGNLNSYKKIIVIKYWNTFLKVPNVTCYI